MQQVKSVEEIIENLQETKSKSIDLVIDDFFAAEEEFPKYFENVLELAGGLDFSLNDDAVRMLNFITPDDESLLTFLAEMVKFSKDPLLEHEFSSLSLYTLVIFKSANLLLQNNLLMKDEAEVISEKMDLYRAFIFDFSRQIRRCFVG